MNAAEVRDLLRFCSSVDPWLKQTSPEEAVVMVGGWGAILQDVPLDTAMLAAKAHYSEPNARTIQPGDLLGAFHAQRRAHGKAEAEQERLALAGPQQGLLPAPNMIAWLRDVMHAALRGEDTSTIPRPSGVRQLSEKHDAYLRRCIYHGLCACDHTTCRDGWMDAEETVTSELGRTYPAVRRCPHCLDALLMAEDRGIAKKPSAATARRR